MNIFSEVEWLLHHKSLRFCSKVFISQARKWLEDNLYKDEIPATSDGSKT